MPPTPSFVATPHQTHNTAYPNTATPTAHNNFTEKNDNFQPKRRPFDILKMLKLESLKNDPDRLLVLGLFLLLSGEETDELLMYALLYIML